MSGLEIKHKKNLHLIRWLLSLLVLGLAFSYAYFGLRWYNTGELSPMPLPVAAADASINESPVTDQQMQAHMALANEPRYLEIPDLGISEARVAKVNLTERNLLDTPKNLDDAGWYIKSATPGSGSGAVLLNGHSDGISRKGSFARLNTLKAGSQLTLERGDGKSFTYEVADVRDMPVEWLVKSGMKEMMRSIKPNIEGLNLITNAGKWIPKNDSFDRRVLVRATLVE